MADIFYQGEDIELVICLFEDDEMTQPVDLTNSKVDMFLYTCSKPETEIRLSTNPNNGEITINRYSDTELRTVIPASISKNIKPGVITVEIAITNNIGDPLAERKNISVSSHIHIEPSRLGTNI